MFGKLWRAMAAQANKLANLFWTADPIAQMQYEYDLAVDQMKSGREGIEQYRALVERVSRQVAANQAHVSSLEARIKAYLQENKNQLLLHEAAYNHNITKIKHASGKLAQIREKIAKYDAELKMSRAEAEVAKLSKDFNFDVTTDFGQIELVIQEKIGLNRAKVRVAADLSSEGIVDIQREQAMEKAMGDQALRDFEVQMGVVSPETAKVTETTKELGPATIKQSS